MANNGHKSGAPRGGMGGPGAMGRPVVKAKNFKKAWGSLLRFCRPYYVIIFVAFGFAVAGTVLRVIGPERVGRIMNLIIGRDGSLVQYKVMGLSTEPVMEKIFDIGIFLAVIYVVMFVFSYLQQYIMATVTQRVARQLRADICEKINKLPLSYYDRTSTGDTLSRVTNDVDTLSTTLNQSVVSLVASVTMLVGSVIMMFTLSWILALTAVVSSIGGFIFMSLIMKRSQKHFVAQQQQLGAINGHIEEYYSGYNIVKVCNANGQANKRFAEMNSSLYQSAWKSQFYSGLMMPLMTFISNFSYLCICVVGGWLVYDGKIDIGIMGSLIIYVRLFNEPMSQLAQAATNLQSTAAASERIFDFLGEAEMEDESGLHRYLDSAKGAVRFDAVKFGYTPDKPVIKGFSADIKSGSKVAIVGPTGAGKTTIVNLLMKFYKVDSGQILIDGVSIDELRRDNVHQLFGMVLQDTWLFEGTVRENLVYNVSDVTDEQLDAACEAVGIDHFIRTLPRGYDTVLDEQASISSGQKQLLTIARAMIKDSPLLILDEATSSVDTRTEVLIQQAMDKLTKGRTTFVIAHRLSTIKNADLILVLCSGDIIESGTHDELIKKAGFYADLYNSQFTLENAEVASI